MRKCRIAIVSLALISIIGSAHAAELSRIDLKDGSSVTGEVISLTNGIYTIKSDVLGMLKIEQIKVRSIQSAADVSAAPSGGTASASDIQTLQKKMMSDGEIMAKIQSLQNDPEFKALLEDPKIMTAVANGDVTALSADPRFVKLLNNTTVQEIQQKVK